MCAWPVSLTPSLMLPRKSSYWEEPFRLMPHLLQLNWSFSEANSALGQNPSSSAKMYSLDPSHLHSSLGSQCPAPPGSVSLCMGLHIPNLLLSSHQAGFGSGFYSLSWKLQQGNAILRLQPPHL